MRSHRRVRMFFHRRVELPRLTLRDPRGALMPHGRETETIPMPLGLGNRTPQMPPVYKSQAQCFGPGRTAATRKTAAVEAVAPGNEDRPLQLPPVYKSQAVAPGNEDRTPQKPPVYKSQAQ